MTLPLFKSYREIPLTQGQIALVDEIDYPSIAKHKWFAKYSPLMGTFYAARNRKGEYGSQETVLMHREILGLEKGDPREGEHIQQSQTLDNRRSNIRIATSSENQGNQRRHTRVKSGFKGVHWYAQQQKWGALVTRNRQRIFLGLSSTKELAARSYDVAALILFGEFAHLNFPRSDYPLVLTTTLPPD